MMLARRRKKARTAGGGDRGRVFFGIFAAISLLGGNHLLSFLCVAALAIIWFALSHRPTV